MGTVSSISAPCRHFTDEVNRNIVASEIEGGVFLRDLGPNSALEVRTQNRSYTVMLGANGEALVWGHPQFCPLPAPARITGSTWGGSMLKVAFIGRGMHMEFRLAGEHRPIITSRIIEIKEIRGPVPLPRAYCVRH